MRLIPGLLVATLSIAAAHAQQAPSPDADKKVCRYQTPTGSNFAKRVCHSKAEWQAIDAVNAQNAERARANRSAINPAQ